MRKRFPFSLPPLTVLKENNFNKVAAIVNYWRNTTGLDCYSEVLFVCGLFRAGMIERQDIPKLFKFLKDNFYYGK